MLIVCPTCAASYSIDPASLGTEGRKVRCSRCQATWFAALGAEAPKATQGADAFAGTATTESVAAAPPTAPAEAAAPPADIPAAASAQAPDDFGPEPDVPIAQVHEAEAEPPPATVVAPPLVPPLGHEPLPGDGHAPPEPEDIESFAARRQRLQSRRKQKRRSSRWTAVVLLLFAANVALIGARSEVVRYLPQTASLFAAIGLPVNLRQLNFENVHIAHETDNGVPILVVEGALVSTAGKPVDVPRLRFAARNPAGLEIYTWTLQPERKVLEPGETLAFRSRLASPPQDARDVMVRFFNASDAAGAK
jgi:predicted Zn finger-like uncharacterized protein